MMSVCHKFSLSPIGFGATCVVCGFTQAQHNRKPTTPIHNTRTPRSHVHTHARTHVHERTTPNRASPNPTTETTSVGAIGYTLRNDLRLTHTHDNQPKHSSRHKHDEAPVNTTRTHTHTLTRPQTRTANQASPSVNRALSKSLEKQSNYLALAAAAAANTGDQKMATKLYEVAAGIEGDKCRLDLEVGRTSRSKSKHTPSLSNRQQTRGRFDNNDDGNGDYDDEEDMSKSWLAASAMSDRSTDSARSGKSSSTTLLASVGYTAHEKIKLAKIFRKFSQDAPSLLPSGFRTFIRQLAGSGHVDAYFCAFDRTHRKSWLNVDDFVLGCAALDPRTRDESTSLHGWKAERARYIFRYYSQGKDKLHYDQFQEMLKHIVKSSGRRESADAINAEVAQYISNKSGLGMSTFVRLVLNGAVPGTNRLLRIAVLDVM
eukprot:m.123936 g.123936  ORF g.123936 m.123936 type:complete len:430 (-) comp29027_c1_seq1:375-1664(-)